MDYPHLHRLPDWPPRHRHRSPSATRTRSAAHTVDVVLVGDRGGRDVVLVVAPQLCWLVYNPINYRYIYHKSQLLEL